MNEMQHTWNEERKLNFPLYTPTSCHVYAADMENFRGESMKNIVPQQKEKSNK